MNRRFISSLTLILGLSSPFGGEAQVASSEPVFRVGDAVQVTVLPTAALARLPELPLLSGRFDIAEDGTIVHPLYRSVQIAGMSQSQAEASVRQILARYDANPQLVVEPLFRVPVNGEVGAPGVYELPPYHTLAQALMLAGGATLTADLKRARLLRDGQVIFADLTSADNPLTSLRVRSGDQIVVDRRRRIWNDTIQPIMVGAGSLASIAFLVLELTGQRN